MKKTEMETVAGPEDAVRFAEQGCSCSESILAAFGPSSGVDAGVGIRLASGFAGGMGSPEGVCGAVTAAYMVLGLTFGPTSLGDGPGKLASWCAVEDFSERFTLRCGALKCGDLCMEADLRDPKKAQALRQSGRPEQIIRAAAEILEEMLP